MLVLSFEVAGVSFEVTDTFATKMYLFMEVLYCDGYQPMLISTNKGIYTREGDYTCLIQNLCHYTCYVTLHLLSSGAISCHRGTSHVAQQMPTIGCKHSGRRMLTYINIFRKQQLHKLQHVCDTRILEETFWKLPKIGNYVFLRES